MPERDFEKQVQEKMGELKLRPGQPVWNRIEKTIRKDKRKRAIFILPLVAALLLLGYTGYKIFTPFRERKHVQVNKQLSPGEKNNPTANKPAESGREQNSNRKSTARDQQSDNPNVKTDKRATDSRRDLVVGKTTGERLAWKAFHKKKDSILIKDEAPIDSSFNSPAMRSPVIINDQPAVNSAPDPVLQKLIDKSPEPKNDHQAVDTIAQTTRASNKEAAFAKSPLSSKDTKKTRIGIQVAIGSADISGKRLSFSKSNTDINSTSGAVIGTPQGPPYTPLAPSEIKAGTAFSIGLEWHRAISKHSGFSTGLRYAYYSNKIMVGTKTSQQLQLAYNYRALDNYYGGSQNEQFTNRYHFLEWPMEYHFRFNNKKKIGFDWASGLILGWLVSSNELMYDTISGGIYFHSKDLFNRTQLGFLTGLSIHLRLKNSAAFLFGPQVYLDLSRMTKQGFDRNRYLFAGTIQARYVFPGKLKK